LAGEVRPVTAGKLRGAEARRLGFNKILDAELGSVTAALERLRLAGPGTPAEQRQQRAESRERELDGAF
jgi:DNA repair protein RadA/Sms